MLNIASGAARIVSNNSTITGLPQSFVDFGNVIAAGAAKDEGPALLQAQ
jgi:ribose transport system permease protein